MGCGVRMVEYVDQWLSILEQFRHCQKNCLFRCHTLYPDQPLKTQITIGHTELGLCLLKALDKRG